MRHTFPHSNISLPNPLQKNKRLTATPPPDPSPNRDPSRPRGRPPPTRRRRRPKRPRSRPDPGALDRGDAQLCGRAGLHWRRGRWHLRVRQVRRPARRRGQVVVLLRGPQLSDQQDERVRGRRVHRGRWHGAAQRGRELLCCFGDYCVE